MEGRETVMKMGPAYLEILACVFVKSYYSKAEK